MQILQHLCKFCQYMITVIIKITFLTCSPTKLYFTLSLSIKLKILFVLTSLFNLPTLQIMISQPFNLLIVEIIRLCFVNILLQGRLFRLWFMLARLFSTFTIYQYPLKSVNSAAGCGIATAVILMQYFTLTTHFYFYKGDIWSWPRCELGTCVPGYWWWFQYFFPPNLQKCILSS